MIYSGRHQLQVPRKNKEIYKYLKEYYFNFFSKQTKSEDFHLHLQALFANNMLRNNNYFIPIDGQGYHLFTVTFFDKPSHNQHTFSPEVYCHQFFGPANRRPMQN